MVDLIDRPETEQAEPEEEEHKVGLTGLVPREGLVVDQEAYQRVRSESLIRKMLREWDSREFLPIVVNRRKGEIAGFHVIDGQHRKEVIDRLPEGVADDLKISIPAVIHMGLSIEQESDLFWKYQRHRKNLTLSEEFKAQLLSNMPEAVDIDRIVRDAGLYLSYSKIDNLHSVSAISALRDIYRHNGPRGLKDVLVISMKTWPHDREGRGYHLLLGLGVFERAYRDDYDPNHLMRMLQRWAPIEMVRAARLRATGNRMNTTGAMLPVIRDIYNRHMRTGKGRLEPLARESL